DIAFPYTVRLTHPRIDRQPGVILHIDDSVHGSEWVDHHKIPITLRNLERKIMVVRSRNSQHVALRLIVRYGPLGAVFVAFLESVRPIRNRAASLQNTF